MRALLFAFIFVSSPLLGQPLDWTVRDMESMDEQREEAPEESLEVKPEVKKVKQPASEDKELDIEQDPEQQAQEVPKDASTTLPSSFQIECNCPQPVQQEQINAGYPPNSVFVIAPQPAPVPEQEVTPPDPTIPPGYGGKMPQGYSDSSYKQIEGSY